MPEISALDIGVAAVTGLIGYATFYLATRAARSTAKAATVAVDAAAYGRAKEIYEGALGTLRAEVESMRLEMQTLRDSNRRLEASNQRLESEVQDLTDELAEYKKARGED